ncbi:eCIS core domain-containing protein [Actinosynnema sp. CS-041913]|uniref:eCIS core domain-containing protein n=1 Tax=Actinosynnema sp. CS-041913 TaxID=3239917 RepID=UPI003D8A79AA
MHEHDEPESRKRRPRPADRPPENARAAEQAPAQQEVRRSAALSPDALLALQRTVGNAAVAGLLAGPHAVQRSAVHEVLGDAGRPLDEPVRAEMETRLGADFSDVRLHTGTTAQRSADEVGARAFTSGNHVVIGDGGSDKHTLAHELVHVIQQRHGPVAGTDRGDGIGISDPGDRFEREAETTATKALSGHSGHAAEHGHEVGPTHTAQRLVAEDDTPVQRVNGHGQGQGQGLQSPRFSGNQTLMGVYSGVPLRAGATGLHVTILQQALADLGFLPSDATGVDGAFGQATTAALTDFQTAVGLPGNGVLNPMTMQRLDGYFAGHAPERLIAAHPNRPLEHGTRPVNPGQQYALSDAVTTAHAGGGGPLPVFQQVIPNQYPYEVRLRQAYDLIITDLFRKSVESKPNRTDDTLMAPAEIDRVAGAAKDAVDAVFGRYAQGPQLQFGLNILDHFEVTDATVTQSPQLANQSVASLVQYLFSSEAMFRRINHDHGAVPGRPYEQALANGVMNAVANDRRAELLGIEYHWPGAEQAGRIKLQRYKGSNDAANRNMLYTLFGTIIHEYLHTLEHPQHRNFVQQRPAQAGGVVLTEGVPDYFAKMVWDGQDFSPNLRRQIEGENLYDPTLPPHPIPLPSRYPEWVNAGQAVGIVGIRNVMAAFFLGRVDLIQMA